MQRFMELLAAIERKQDELVMLGGELSVAMVEAQRALKLSGVVTQPAVDAFVTAQAHLVAARGSTVSGHKAVEKIARVFGIQTVAADQEYPFGDNTKYAVPFTGATDTLPAVAA